MVSDVWTPLYKDEYDCDLRLFKGKVQEKTQHENNKTDTTKQEYNVLCVSDTKEDLNIIKFNFINLLNKKKKRN